MTARKFETSLPTAAKYGIGAVVTIGLLAVLNPFYEVDEGHVGVVKRFGEAVEQTDPGLHTLIPVIDEVVPIEVRTRKNVEKHAAATKEQMPVTVEVSVNWTVDKSEALDLYKRYGSLDQFENRVLDPRLRAATKDAISHYTSEDLIKNRIAAVAEAMDDLTRATQDFPITLDSLQIENIALPVAYLKSIEDKQTAKNRAAEEEHKLAQQQLQSQQRVNTAKAQAAATREAAEADAYATRQKALADAEAIRQIGDAEAAATVAKIKAFGSAEAVVRYEHIKKWNGTLPTTSLGGEASVLMQVPSAQ